MGGFFLVCKGRTAIDRKSWLGCSGRFAELGFASPEIVEARDYVFAGYPALWGRIGAADTIPKR